VDARWGRPSVPAEVMAGFWSGIRAGLTREAAAEAIGVSVSTAGRWFVERGGVMPPLSAGRRGRCLCFAEREQIAVLSAGGLGVRAVAAELGRAASTISRELRRVQHHDRHRVGYRASTAQADADRQARRPKPAKLATHLQLRRQVQDRLRSNHSPSRSPGGCVKTFPTIRRCGCHTRRSISRCLCRPVAG
jgi:IS30 family transposase